jgi:hypothetical protein
LTLVKPITRFANMANEQTVSDVVAATVKEVRTGQGMTVAGLAARCKELGAPDLTAHALYKLEARRPGKLRPRPVTVDELLALGRALNIAPVYLLTGLGGGGEPYPITETVREPAGRVREWIRGTIEGSLLPGVNRLAYLTHRPGSEAARLRVTEEGGDDGQR